MTPISTAITMIEEVIVLRKARRLSADVRRHFSTAAGRGENRNVFKQYLTEHPLAPDTFRHFLSRVERLFGDGDENEQDALDRGWF